MINTLTFKYDIIMFAVVKLKLEMIYNVLQVAYSNEHTA